MIESFILGDSYNNVPDGINVTHMKNPAGYGDQSIFVVRINKKNFTPHFCQFAELQRPSSQAKDVSAELCINGGFYSTKNHMVPSLVRVNNHDLYNPYWIDNTTINGLIVFDDKVFIRPYINNDNEHPTYKTCFSAGPILRLENNDYEISDKIWATDKGPRTIFGYNKYEYLVLLIEGREDDADGMDPWESQKFCKELEIENAINLDGGGSSVLYLKNYGVVNRPTDGCERKVANCIYF